MKKCESRTSWPRGRSVLSLLGVLLSGVLMLCRGDSAAASTSDNAYVFSFKTLIDEQPLPLEQFRGKVLLVVNTASNCGFTKQYEGLQKLHEKYSSQGLVVLGVPSNDFGGQEPGTAEQIGQFCSKTYGVTFPMTAKEVVSGSKAHPFYLWARAQLGFGTAPKWNFHKYLIDRNGVLVEFYNSTTSPTADSVVEKIEALLSSG